MFRGKELEECLQNAMQSAFQLEGIVITPAQVQRVLGTIPQSVFGGKVVMIVEQFPLDSLQARGRFKGLVYQVVNKTGNQYTRHFTKSRNPRTPAQQA